MYENTDLIVEFNRRVLLGNVRLRRYGLSLYDPSNAPLRLKVRMLKAEVMEIMPYGCVTWSPTVAHLAIMRTAHRRNRRGGYCMHWYADDLVKTINSYDSVETTLRKRRMMVSGGSRLVRIRRGFQNE